MTQCVAVSSNEGAHQSSSNAAATTNSSLMEATSSTEANMHSQDSGFGSQPSKMLPSPPAPSYLGQNLRITACANQGGRKYMEDRVHVHVERDEVTGAIEWTYVAVYDGHGGPEASEYCRQNLLKNIRNEKDFNSEDDGEFLEAIRSGFLKTHHTMWKEVDTWERTASGYPSTAGTTASCAFIRRGKVYTGHVGDSAILLTKRSNPARYKRLTEDHKPESTEEKKRIEACGGSVMQKQSVHRVVWTRAPNGHVGALRRTTPTQTIPFLAVARSLGDFWSYIQETQEFAVSPNPDVGVIALTPDHHALVLASDGLTNVMNASLEAAIMHDLALEEDQQRWFTNPNEHPNHARILMRRTMLNWRHFRADNVSVLAVVFDKAASTGVSSSTSSDEGVVDSSTDRPVELPKHSCVDAQLAEYPLSMIHVTNEKTTRCQTAPVSLIYRGNMDENFFPMHSVGPGFVLGFDSTPDEDDEVDEAATRAARLQTYYDVLGVGSRDVTPENQPPATSTSNLTNVHVAPIGAERKAKLQKFTCAAAALIDELRRDGDATAAAAASNAATAAAAEKKEEEEAEKAAGAAAWPDDVPVENEESDARPCTPENRPEVSFAVLRTSRSTGAKLRKSRLYEDDDEVASGRPSTSSSSRAAGGADRGGVAAAVDDDDANAADMSMAEEELEIERSPDRNGVLKLALPFAPDDDDVEMGEASGAEGAADDAARENALRTPSPIGDDANSDEVVRATPVCNSTATEREMVRRVTRSAAATSIDGSKKEMIVHDRPATRRSLARNLAPRSCGPILVANGHHSDEQPSSGEEEETREAALPPRTPKVVLRVEEGACLSVSSRTRSHAAPHQGTPPGRSGAMMSASSGSRKRPRSALPPLDNTTTTPLLARISLTDENAESDGAARAGTPNKWPKRNRQPFGSSDQAEPACTKL